MRKDFHIIKENRVIGFLIYLFFCLIGIIPMMFLVWSPFYLVEVPSMGPKVNLFFNSILGVLCLFIFFIFLFVGVYTLRVGSVFVGLSAPLRILTKILLSLILGAPMSLSIPLMNFLYWGDSVCSSLRGFILFKRQINEPQFLRLLLEKANSDGLILSTQEISSFKEEVFGDNLYVPIVLFEEQYAVFAEAKQEALSLAETSNAIALVVSGVIIIGSILAIYMFGHYVGSNVRPSSADMNLRYLDLLKSLGDLNGRIADLEQIVDPTVLKTSVEGLSTEVVPAQTSIDKIEALFDKLLSVYGI